MSISARRSSCANWNSTSSERSVGPFFALGEGGARNFGRSTPGRPFGAVVAAVACASSALWRLSSLIAAMTFAPGRPPTRPPSSAPTMPSASCGVGAEERAISPVSVASALDSDRIALGVAGDHAGDLRREHLLDRLELVRGLLGALDLAVAQTMPSRCAASASSLSRFAAGTEQIVERRARTAHQGHLDRRALRAVGDLAQPVGHQPEHLAGVLALQLVEADADRAERLGLVLRAELGLAHADGQAAQADLELVLGDAGLRRGEAEGLQILGRDPERARDLGEAAGIIEALLDLLGQAPDRERREQAGDRGLGAGKGALDLLRLRPRDRRGLVGAGLELGGAERQRDAQRADQGVAITLLLRPADVL
jgi:hypothetical protein